VALSAVAHSIPPGLRNRQYEIQRKPTQHRALKHASQQIYSLPNHRLWFKFDKECFRPSLFYPALCPASRSISHQPIIAQPPVSSSITSPTEIPRIRLKCQDQLTPDPLPISSIRGACTFLEWGVPASPQSSLAWKQFLTSSMICTMSTSTSVRSRFLEL
jgi:hypothetical protein